MTVAELRERFAALPPQPGLSELWTRMTTDIRKLVASHNPAEFVRWSPIVTTMFVGDCEAVRRQYRDIPARMRAVVHDPGVGGAPTIHGAGVEISGNLIHQAYHLRQWEVHSGREVADLKRIVEFGGGYGSMALIARRLGFEGEYVIHDLPEFLLLQEFYLSGSKVDDVTFSAGPVVGASDLMIATCSITEVSEELRDKFIEDNPAEAYLVLLAPEWDGINQEAWAREMAESRPDLRWVQYPSEHFVDRIYLLGA